MRSAKRARKLGDWRLEGCTMYVTLEPCQMCAGALVQSRIDEVVIGSMNPKAGCAGSVLNLLEVEGFNHQVKTTRGVLQEECSASCLIFLKNSVKRKNSVKCLRNRRYSRYRAANSRTCFLRKSCYDKTESERRGSVPDGGHIM